MISKFIRDPLLHFTLAGAAVFGAHQLISGGDEGHDAGTIVVDQEALLTFIQYRSKTFQNDQARQQLASMGSKERAELIRDYVREEALHREAQALGLLENDYIIRRRSVQKLEFIAEGIAEQTIELNDGVLEAYFEEHRHDYYEEPSYSFTHVFVNSNTNSPAERADALLAKLNTSGVGFSSATQYGDRFLYHRNYVERTPAFIASHFGEAFKTSLEQLKPDTGQWHGPIVSKHGLHLVMLSKHQPGRIPSLAEVRSRVEDDFLRWKQQQKQELAIQQIVEQYNVENRL
ncbi:peptidyl-prolyl cis-trans isomerase [Marinobacter sp. F4216]|uniref:peptidylprolyl isomerase n=1 Tax=Marinobacter sp. F4216 TaxID=2874281 RepID=UPI001CBBAF69|nr:peptidylprolyl isomerase [Marinobacter sp. F4216]MBZ2168374.1 peptidyl-prolyl cis-trans isomerase [Marinobacter sp. F4216]